MDVLYKNNTTILIERFIFYKNKIQKYKMITVSFWKITLVLQLYKNKKKLQIKLMP
jgi:hypothetical protein